MTFVHRKTKVVQHYPRINISQGFPFSIFVASGLPPSFGAPKINHTLLWVVLKKSGQKSEIEMSDSGGQGFHFSVFDASGLVPPSPWSGASGLSVDASGLAPLPPQSGLARGTAFK